MLDVLADASNPWLSWKYVQNNWEELVAAGQEHIMLTVASVVLAILVAIPLAMLVRKVPRAARARARVCPGSCTRSRRWR